ncbi:hypothetical protein ACIBHX_31815 [Nonomuraea sp. NPDC050536]|uniref:hypothetical protein n=1 Tax=Nonomuraea sp. NPDC050536 TaxID=3364366 RepID=UPI0037C698F2
MKIRHPLIAGALVAVAVSGTCLTASATTTAADANSRYVCQAYVSMAKAQKTYRGTEGDIATPYYRRRAQFEALQTVASENSAMAKLLNEAYQVTAKGLKAAEKGDYSKLKPYETNLATIDKKIRSYCA